jgi:hypothetical protein
MATKIAGMVVFTDTGERFTINLSRSTDMREVRAATASAAAESGRPREAAVAEGGGGVKAGDSG